LAVFYILVASVVLLWAIDAFLTGTVRFSPEPVQLAFLAAAVYGLIQVIPFGTINAASEIGPVPRMISLDRFATEESAIHYLALFLLFAATLVVLDSAR